jgi:hypothetical protein
LPRDVGSEAMTGTVKSEKRNGATIGALTGYGPK